MQHTFGGSFIDALHSLTQGLGVFLGPDGGKGVLGPRLDFTADGLIALSALQVGDIALFLALNVCHGLQPSLDEQH